ncbi:Arc family DNA-binding protein [Chromobacterium violaceum]|uniref:Arc family DNA-binding protein n=1 Tax=Chromobacterium violaceum TaxID=536 RepID=UPI003CED166A
MAKNQIKPTPVRIEDEMKQWLRHRAVDNRRSLNSEILIRLAESRKREEEQLDKAA